MFKTNHNNAEIEKFSQLANHWWELDGELKTLHDINPTRVQFICNHVDFKNKKVLDVGCGGGILTESLAKLGCEVTGIDLAAKTIEVAKQHAKQSGLVIQYYCKDIADLAQEQPEQYDIVTCMEMLEHVSQPEIIINNCAKLIKPTGHLFLSTINRTLTAYLFAIIGAEYLFKLLPYHTHSYEKLIRPSELASWLRKNNMEIGKIVGMGYNPLLRKAYLTSQLSVNYLLHAKFSG